MIRRKYFFLITFIFSFLVNSSFSQEILVSEGRKFSVFDLEAKSIYKIDLENQEFRILTEKRNLGPFKLTLENVKFEDIDQSILVNSFKNSAGEIYVSILGTGQIYQLNVKSRIFRRIDKTFYRGYNFFAIPLIRKDTIYSIGGYGFWHINNVPTFFDLKLNEWELMPNNFNEEMPLTVVSKF